MCTQTLWRAFGRRDQAPIDVAEPGLAGSVLGAWATKLFHYDRRRLVLALNERTYLTLVMPLAPRANFRAHFTTALESALEDLGVPSAAIAREAVVIDFLPLARLTNRRLVGSQKHLEFLAHCELDYTDDLRRVQRNLNDVPHVNRDPCCPIDAVRQVFRLAPEDVGRPLVN